MQGALLFLHTQLRTLYHGGGQRLPSTIVFACGLLLPVAVVWGTKYPVGQRVKRFVPAGTAPEAVFTIECANKFGKYLVWKSNLLHLKVFFSLQNNI